MKKILGLLMLMFSTLALGQHTADKRILISEHQPDDIYLAGNTIRINAIVEGDVVAAGRKNYRYRQRAGRSYCDRCRYYYKRRGKR